MKLFERLKIPLNFTEFDKMEVGLELAYRLPPKCTDHDRAWSKFEIPFNRFLLSLECYYCDEWSLFTSHAKQGILDCDDFFFGSWRSEYTTPEKTVDAAYWKRDFDWMQIFEAALLWGSVLGEWEFLKKVGTFPEPDSCFSGTYRAQDRDLYVALGAFLRKVSPTEMETMLERASIGSRKSCKLLVTVIRACLSRDATLIQKNLIEFLKHYKKSEFPKEYIAKKISVEGTFFVHWVKREGFSITVPAEFTDYIVRLTN